MENGTSFIGLDFSPELNMARYLQNIRKFPLLSQDEEYQLAVEYKQTGDKNIAYRLITSHLRLVVKVVSQYKGYGLPVSEMISEGNIGLIKAVELYDPKQGNTFLSFAIHYIRKYINIALNEKSRVVRLPFNRICEGDSLSASSLDASVSDDDDNKTFGDMLSGDMDANDYDTKDYNEKAIKHIFSLLTDREKYIISKLYGIGCRQCTKLEIAIYLRISEERVRQLSLSIIEKIRQAY